jgi:hypothetical protein
MALNVPARFRAELILDRQALDAIRRQLDSVFAARLPTP